MKIVGGDYVKCLLVFSEVELFLSVVGYYFGLGFGFFGCRVEDVGVECFVNECFLGCVVVVLRCFLLEFFGSGE